MLILCALYLCTPPTTSVYIQKQSIARGRVTLLQEVFAIFKIAKLKCREKKEMSRKFAAANFKRRYTEIKQLSVSTFVKNYLE